MTVISRKLAIATIGLLGGVISSFGTTHAQEVAGQNVAERSHPEYDPIPIPVASFSLLPTTTLRLVATDNYRASNSNRQSDVYVVIRPAATLRSNWSRHQLSADAFYERAVHFKLGNEDANSLGTTFRGLYDISRNTQVSGDFSVLKGVESRSALGSFRGSLEPVQFSTLRASLGISQSFNDLSLTGRGSVEKLDFSDARIAGGGEIDQDFRDFERVTATGSARYALRNGIGVVGTLQYDKAQYDFGPGSVGFIPGSSIDRQSSGISAQAGVSLELTRLIFGTIQAGYLNRHYDDSRLRDFSGLTFTANVLWNPTPITSVNLRAGRVVEESAAITFAGNIRSNVSVQVNHELYRFILLSGELEYGGFRANGPGPRGDEFGASIAGRYLLNRRFSLTGSLRHASRSSNLANLRFSATSGSVGLKFAF